jgi:hypothetical protein
MRQELRNVGYQNNSESSIAFAHFYRFMVQFRTVAFILLILIHFLMIKRMHFKNFGTIDHKKVKS